METQMVKKSLTPRKIVNSEGKVHYSESNQAWNILKLKKEMFEEFPQLKEKRASFSYRLVYHLDIKELEQSIKKMLKSVDGVVPLLLWLYKD